MKKSTKQQKIDRMRAALSHREGDRVPVGDGFWTGFVERCRDKWGAGFDPYRHFDLDYIIITPNMDPKIQQFEVVEQEGENILIKTGFGATIRRSGRAPMPHYDGFSISSAEQMAEFGFDSPTDKKRFFEAGDDQINCVGDALLRNLPSWDDRLNSYKDDFCLFGSVCEPYEYLWRIIGTENALLWAGMETEKLKAFIDRIGDFILKFAEVQIENAKGRLDGMYIWGDVAYVNGMLFSPDFWRSAFKPHVKALIDLFHKHGLMVIYHGCGDARKIYDDFVEIGLDCYNPLEVKAGLDVVELKKKYKGKLAFCGNIDVRILEEGNPEAIAREVEYKLQAAKGGGWIFQSDHSVSSGVAPESYELAINVLREKGNFPLSV
jgi:uroporphyrinogen decarboxylase